MIIVKLYFIAIIAIFRCLITYGCITSQSFQDLKPETNWDICDIEPCVIRISPAYHFLTSARAKKVVYWKWILQVELNQRQYWYFKLRLFVKFHSTLLCFIAPWPRVFIRIFLLISNQLSIRLVQNNSVGLTAGERVF